ncbi:MAG: hypothetical protein ACK559_09115, partial [bacterium]
LEALADLPGRHVAAVLAGQRARVREEGDADGGLFDLHAGQGLRALDVGEGVADVEVFDAGDGADLARRDPVGLDLLQALLGVELLHADPAGEPVFADERVV